MNSQSLRLRLLIGAALSIAAALALAFFFISLIFERHIERRVVAELEQQVLHLAGELDAGDTGLIRTTGDDSDGRYAKQLSGFYWQILVDGKITERSRSLWDEELKVAAAEFRPGIQVVLNHDGGNLGPLKIAGRAVVVAAGGIDHRVTLLAAMTRAEITAPLAEFRTELALSLAALGIALFTGAAAQVLFGLQPLGRLRRGLSAILAGKESRMTGRFPSELQPLVNEFNGLLDTQARSIERARARAGDLAHGLKTPLTIIGGATRRLREAGARETGREIDAEVETMRRHIERELARARIATGRAHELVELYPAVGKIIDTMRRLPRGGELSFENRVPAGLKVVVERSDLDEILGNLLDNARSFARARVTIGSEVKSGRTEITVADDGPGIPAELRGHVLERGVRLDEARPGTGLGLSIVADIAEAYGAGVALELSETGGLLVRLTLAG